jgi:hypothetical protein
LTNLSTAWNYDASDIASAQDGANTATFNFGAQGVIPYEKALVVTGTAPGSTAGATKTRSFYTKRAISMESSTIAMKRAEATMFTVGFRILPTVADTGYEYGKIVDQT